MAVRGQTEQADFPYWLVVAGALAAIAAVLVAVNGVYSQVFWTLIKGLGVTLRVTVIAFALCSIVGLLIALMNVSGSIWLRQIGRFYVEIIRGIPMMVLLFWIAFAGAPALVIFWNWITIPLQNAGVMAPMLVRDFSLEWRAVLALVIGYSAFSAEIFRAGLQSVEVGQVEAAKALGLNGFQRFRLVVWPQAFRTIFPPYSNEFVSMVKDSSLVSVLGVTDITQLGKIYSASSFRYFETYTIVAFIYLILTIGLSLALRRLERRMYEQRTTAPEH